MKRTILIAALTMITLTGCTPAEISAWLKWNRSDPAAAQAHLATPEVQAELAEMAGATAVADRLDPPAPAPVAAPAYSTASANGRCVGFEGLLAQYSPGWDVGRMSGIMYRESRCQPGVSNSCCHGLLQMHEMHVGWIDAVNSASDYYDPTLNIRAAAELWRESGYGAWSTS